MKSAAALLRAAMAGWIVLPMVMWRGVMVGLALSNGRDCFGCARAGGDS